MYQENSLHVDILVVQNQACQDLSLDSYPVLPKSQFHLSHIYSNYMSQYSLRHVERITLSCCQRFLYTFSIRDLHMFLVYDYRYNDLLVKNILNVSLVLKVFLHTVHSFNTSLLHTLTIRGCKIQM